MNRKNSIITFALVGLAAGTVAWLLLGTKDGRKQLNRASDGIRSLSKTVRHNTKKGIDKAAALADKATKEIQELRAKAKSSGSTAINKADQATKSAVNKVDDAVKTARRKAQKVV